LTYFFYHLPLFLVNATSPTETVQFTSKGQVVIPARLRRQFQIEDGTKASVTTTPDGILIRPITRSYIKSLRGSLKGKGVMKAMMADRKREREL
jgi:AbrB family looped-hinge helix DNA binding protein